MTHIQLCLLPLLLPTTTSLTWQLDTWASNSIRVRVAPPGSSIIDPVFRGLLPNSPGQSVSVSSNSSTNHLVNGNLEVRIDSETGKVEVWRVSDHQLLLNQTLLSFSKPSTRVTDPQSVASLVVFDGHGPSEKIYGLG